MTINDFGRNSFVTHTTGLIERIQEAEKEIQMREIKFRAWADGKMHYDNFSIEFNGGEMDSMIAYTNSDGKVATCEEFILMQFAGLKDKNGKEYYFDDITRWNSKLWIIVWSITLSSIELQPLDNYIERQDNPEVKRLFGTSFGIGQAHCSTYIGNIHTTPELLEQDNGR